MPRRARKPEGSIRLHARVSPGTSERLKALAASFGLLYGGEGSLGQLLDALANHDLLVIKASNVKKCE